MSTLNGQWPIKDTSKNGVASGASLWHCLFNQFLAMPASHFLGIKFSCVHICPSVLNLLSAFTWIQYSSRFHQLVLEALH